MPITFDCACGKDFRVGDEYAGKRTKCPACRAPLTVPAPGAEPEPEPASGSAEDEAYRALMDSPDPEPAPHPTRFAARTEEAAPARPSPISAKALTPERAAQFNKPSAAERKARKHRDPRPRDPERGRKILYMIGGGLMILGGIALVALAFEAGAIRAGVFGGFLAFGGVGTFFQGVSGNFDDDA